jgi:hypothetical protein
VRAFRQRGEDQIVTLFGVAAPWAVRRHRPLPRGLRRRLRRDGLGREREPHVGEGTRASLDYSRAAAEWNGRSPDFWALAHVASQALRRSDIVHDLTATVESLVPVTSTRVFVLYKLNTAVAAPGFEQASAGGRAVRRAGQPGAAVQHRQVAWEALVAGEEHVPRRVRQRARCYDELLVVRAPTRVLGGSPVKF